MIETLILAMLIALALWIARSRRRLLAADVAEHPHQPSSEA